MFWFCQMFKNEQKLHFFTHKEFVFFFNWEILVAKFVDSYLENSWKHVMNSIIVNVMRKPLYLVNIFDQLETLPTVPLKKVSHDTYKKTHLTQLSRNEFCNLFALGPAPVRVSKRTKMPTQKFQGENFIFFY